MLMDSTNLYSEDLMTAPSIQRDHRLPPSMFTFHDCSWDLGTLTSLYFNLTEGNKDDRHLKLDYLLLGKWPGGRETQSPGI